MTTDQRTKADAFRALHRRPDPLLIFNVWDGVTGKAIAPHVRAIVDDAPTSVAVAEAGARRISLGPSTQTRAMQVFGVQAADIAKSLRRHPTANP